METGVRFRSDDLDLAGKFADRGSESGVVITHPHPLYGGEMHNPVVEAMAQAYGRCGISTLRFNFRGVGESQGSFDNGQGETGDVRAAMQFLKDRGLRPSLAGYSFGTRIIANIDADEAGLDHMIFVAPPVAFMPFEGIGALPRLKLVIAGEQDEFGPPALIEPLLKIWNPDINLTVMTGADHFLFHHLDRIGKHVEQFLKGA